jgi:3-methyladenine DNA glycosylase AlkD
MTAEAVIKELKSQADAARATAAKRYFKTGKGEYGEGDRFIGLTVPQQRTIAKKCSSLELVEIQKLISSGTHECRFTAFVILVNRYKNAGKIGDEKEKAKIVAFYLKNKEFINNWDLVDMSSSYILGNWLIDKDRPILYKLAKSKSLWDRRIAIISSGAFIVENDFKDTLRLAELLLNDEHDLIHKAVGWMLREIGKRSLPTLEGFLKIHAKNMPRTMLRYAIEKMSERKRQKYLGN